MVSPALAEILLVDDDEDDVMLTMKLLADAKLSNHIRVAHDGEQALERLRRRGEYAEDPHTDLVLLDLNMPVKDGFETLEEIRADPELKRVPVVVLTTSGADQDVLKSYDMNANCFVQKPVDLQQFAKVISLINGFWLQAVRFPRLDA